MYIYVCICYIYTYIYIYMEIQYNISKYGNHVNFKPIYFPSYGNLKVIFETMFRHSTSSSFILIFCDLYINKESKYNFEIVFLRMSFSL